MTSLNPVFLAHVARVTADVLKRRRSILDAPAPKTQKSAAAIVASPLMAAHARSLNKASAPSKEKKAPVIKRFEVETPRRYYHLPENLPQPLDAAAEVFINKGRSEMEKLSCIAPNAAIRGAAMFYYLERVASAVPFDIATIGFSDGRSIALNADCHVAVENVVLRHDVTAMTVDCLYDDGRGPFTMSFLTNRSYRRHWVTLTVPWEKRVLLRKLAGPSDDPANDENTITKRYFHFKEVLAFARRARRARISFDPVLELRGTRLIKARDLTPQMKIAGGMREDPQPSFTVKSVVISKSSSSGICIYGHVTMPFYRLYGIPIFAPPSSLKKPWNEVMAPE